jgi:uncharacterized protein
MPAAITAFYAALLALLVTALAINVTAHRVKLKIPIGDGDDPRMLRMIRVHGNAAEYVPLGIVLMGLYEINGGSHAALQIAGVALVVCRLLVVWGMWNTAGPTFGRRVGMTLNWFLMAALAALNLWQIA